MRKSYLFIAAVVFTFASNSHTFITQILVDNNPNQYPTSDQYNTVQSYSFNEDEILDAYNEGISYARDNNQRIKDRIQLETLKQVLPAAEPGKLVLCEDDSGGRNIEKTCGQFDHFNTARSAAIKTCFRLNKSHPGQYPSGLIPRFSGPATFVDQGTATDDHHSIYHLSHGLYFSCVEILLFTE